MTFFSTKLIACIVLGMTQKESNCLTQCWKRINVYGLACQSEGFIFVAGESLSLRQFKQEVAKLSTVSGTLESG